LVWALVNQQLDVRSRLGAIAGHATLIRAKSGVEKKFSTFHPEGPVIDLISKKLREKFDPRQLFNQGTFG
jgi:glycolate oxidase FAD binding subunit